MVLRISQYFPLGLYFLMCSVHLIYRYIIEKFYAEKPTPFYLLDPSELEKPEIEKKQLRIKNQSILSNLDKIEHIMINPDVFFKSNPSELKFLLVDQVLYSTLRFPEEDEMTSFSRRSDSRLEDATLIQINPKTNREANKRNLTEASPYTRNYQNLNITMKEENIGEFLIDEDRKFQQEEIFKAIALCHNTKTKMNKNGSIRYDYWSLDDQRAIEYASLRGFHFEGIKYSKTNLDYRCYTLQIKGEMTQYPVLSVNKTNENTKTFSIVVQDIADEELEPNSSVIYIKSTEASILDKFDLEQNYLAAVKDLLHKSKFDGCRYMIYGKKYLNAEQTLEYIEKVNIARSRLVNSEIDSYFQELESDFNLVTVAFFHNKIYEPSKNFIRNCKIANIPLWLITNCSESCTMTVAYQTKIFEKSFEIYDFKIDSVNSGMIALNNILAKIKTKILMQEGNPQKMVNPSSMGKEDDIKKMNPNTEEWKEFALVIDGDSLNILKTDLHLLEHFKFLLCFCKGFMGYHMSQSHKLSFLRILKETFPNKLIMSMGDNYSDFPAIFESNVGVIIRKMNDSPDEETIIVDEGDINSNNIEMVSDLIFVRSKTINWKLDVVLDFIFYCSFLFANQIFMFFSDSNFLSFMSYDNIQIVMKDFFVPICPILLFLFNSDDKEALILANAPFLYKEKNFKIRRTITLFIFKIIVRSIVDSVLIYYIIMTNLIYDKGVLNSFQVCSVEIFYSIGLIIYQYFNYKIKKDIFLESYLFWLLQYTFYFYFLLALLQLTESNLFNETIVTTFLEKLVCFNSLFIYAYIYLTQIYINHLLEDYFFTILDCSNYDAFLLKLKQGNKFSQVIEEHYLLPPPKTNALVEITEKAKNFFTKTKMDNSIQECIFKSFIFLLF